MLFHRDSHKLHFDCDCHKITSLWKAKTTMTTKKSHNNEKTCGNLVKKNKNKNKKYKSYRRLHNAVADYKIFWSVSAVKCSLCQIRWLQIHKFLSCCGWETRQTTCCSQVNQRLQFMMSPALATDYYYWQADVGGRQKIKHASLSVVRLWGIPDAASVVIHYDTLREMKESAVVPDAYRSFPSLPDALRLLPFANMQ